MTPIRIRSSIAPFLDAEGFISRECPNPACKRQFRVHNEGTATQSSYFCPYCRNPGAGEAWWTEDQARFEEERRGMAGELVAGALFDKLKRPGMKTRGRLPTKEELQASLPKPPAHADASRLVVPPCHPSARLKVREDWRGPIHCFACGKVA